MSNQSKTKKINAKLFEIIKRDIDVNSYNFQEIFLNKISSSTISDRYQKLNRDDGDNEGYVVTFFEKTRNTIFGVFTKLLPENSIHMAKTALDKNNISLQDLTHYSINEQEGIIKDYWYFCMYKNKLLINCGRYVRPFQTYINWLINDNELYECRPVITMQEDLQLGNIKNISINDKYLSARDNEPTVRQLRKTLRNFIPDLYKKLFDDVLPEDINIQDIISAEILLKFKQINGKSKNEDYQNTLKAILKAGAVDDLVVTTKNNKVIRGAEIETTHSFDVELTEKAQLPNEETIKQEMIAYITR